MTPEYPLADLMEVLDDPQSSGFNQTEFFHTPEREPWTRISVGGHFEIFPVKSTEFRRLLESRIRASMGRMPTDALVKQTLKEIEAASLFDGKQHPIFFRTARHGAAIYIDLGTDDWSAVKITGDGWSVVAIPPVYFRRGVTARPLPIPATGGNASELFDVINVPERQHQILVLAWLVAALRPSGPYPLLAMSGRQGSAKTTTQGFLRRLVDPSSTPLLSTPRDERDLVIAAKHSHVLGFDNLSRLSNGLSDALCRLSTGSGFATRQLYTDDKQMTFNGQRPVMFNGIDQIADRSDLLDRMIVLTLPKVTTRKTDTSLRAKFDQIAGTLFGALLDAVSCALKNYDSISLPSLPRMAEFAQWSVAAGPALGFTQDEFIEAYDANRQELSLVAIENSPIDAIVTWFRARFHYGNLQWSGTHGDLLKDLKFSLTYLPAGFPKTARALSAELARIEPNLVEVGLQVNHLKREPGTGRRLIQIEATPETATKWTREREESQAVAEKMKEAASAAVRAARQEKIAARQSAVDEWLKAYLADGEPKKRKEVYSASQTANEGGPFSREMLKQALKNIGGEESLNENGGNLWKPKPLTGAASA
ncbi:MAG: hypothetical protein WAM79_14345 [Candidatus Sulfotelmatobacter sp.]